MLSGIIKYLPTTLQKALYKSGFFFISMIFFHFSDKSKKDIFLFSTRRGGSTMLGQIISVNPGIRNIDQPLTTHAPPGVAGSLRKRLTTDYLPAKEYSQYPSLTNDDQKKIFQYVSLMLEGKVSLNRWLEYKASKKILCVYTDRVLLKLTDANAVIDWFVDTFSPHVIYLVRHPVANALSIMKNNWGITAAAYLDDKNYCDKYLTQEQKLYGEQILDSGDYFQQAILNWCLENLVPLNFSQHEYLTLTYEELVMCPEKIIDLLSVRFSLPDRERMLSVSRMPSYSSTLSDNRTVRSIVNETSNEGKYNHLVNRWSHKITDVESKRAMEILKVFNIDIYDCDSSIPKNQYLHFPEFFMSSIPNQYKKQ